jgi:hypothetical protein
MKEGQVESRRPEPVEAVPTLEDVRDGIGTGQTRSHNKQNEITSIQGQMSDAQARESSNSMYRMPYPGGGPRDSLNV